MRNLTAALLAAAALAVPAAASAQAADVGDVRCLITLVGLTGNEKIRPQAVIGVYFYASRILAKQPNFDFAGIRAEAEKMHKADFQKEVGRCDAALNAAAQKVQSVQTALNGFTPKD